MESLRVLLVEDNPADARLVREMLDETASGCVALLHVTRLAAALQRLDEHDADVVLLDLSLPDAQGLDGLTRLRAAAPRVPVIILSGCDDETLAVRGVREGAQDYLLKGRVESDLLLRAMRYAIERQQSAQALRAAQEALRASARELERSNAELQQFAATAAHDLRSPLATIGGFARLLRLQYEGQLDAEADEYITFIAEAVARLHALIDALLAYSRVGAQAIPREPVDCAGLLDEVIAALGAAIATSGAVIAHTGLPTVHGDAAQLGQLFQNLIGNGIKFHGAAPPVIIVSAEREGAEWLFAVRDNGIGIDPAQAERIFGVFQRLHGRGEYEGTGLGLAICKKIVERHGGRIWVESRPGQGATFRFTLPVLQAQDQDRPVLQAQDQDREEGTR